MPQLYLTPGTRIDNRNELADRLSLARASVARMTTAELILAAYQRWGEDCPQYLLGDFAFAIEDSTKLFLARDPLGICPLYLGEGDSGLVYGGEVEEVLAQPGMSSALSPQATLSYLLTGGIHGPELTLYQHVTRLPAAHTLTLSGGDKTLRRYWHPEAVPRLPAASSADYSARLRALLEDAVRVRLPCEGPVGSHLSGGLDSSAIVGLAASQLEDLSRLQAWSWMRPPASAEEALEPEWSQAEAVARKWQVPLHFTSFSESDFLAILRRNPLRENDSADLWYEYPVRAQLQARGIAVMLSGWGGDQFISNSGEGAYLEGLLSRNAGNVLADFTALAKGSRRPARAALTLAWHQLGGPLFDYLQARCQRAAFNGWGDCGLALTTPAFQQWVRQHGVSPPRVKPRLRVRGRQLQELAHGAFYNRIEAWAASGHRAGVVYRYPLLDQRVIAFALGLPPDQYCSEGTMRRIFRTAMRDYFPPLLHEGVSKREPRRVEEVYAIVRAGLQRYLREQPPADTGLIDVNALQRAAAALPPPAADLPEAALLALLTVKRATILAGLGGDLPNF